MKFVFNGMFVLNFVWRARRKDKESGSLSGTSSPGPSSNASSGGGGGPGGAPNAQGEPKLYVEPAVLECTLPEPKIRELVNLPNGLDYNEWLASHTIAFFEHINLIYGTVSEYCTMSGCPDMTGPKFRQYLWLDEKGKKVRVAAPQYIDYVMTFTQKTVNDESIFPTKFERDFPPTFDTIIKRIHRLLFHVVAHLYHGHFQELVLLNLHAHLNSLFTHFILFNDQFRVLEEKETEVLYDLAQALKLYPLPETIEVPTTATPDDKNLSSSPGSKLDFRKSSGDDRPPSPRVVEGGNGHQDTMKVLTRPPTSASSITALHTRTGSGGGRSNSSCAMDSAMVHYPNVGNLATTSAVVASSQEQSARLCSASPIKFQ